MQRKFTLLSLAALFWACLAHANPVIFKPDGESKGKIVFVASDHEYRSEETCPALARILARHHGFTTVVCFGVDANGEIEAGASNIQGLENLKDADLMVMFTRFQNLPDEQMAHIDAYLNRGGPVVGLRTATHGFRIPASGKFAKYDFGYKGEDYVKGFGHQVLGQTWVGHYGQNHKQSTRIDIVPEKKDHPILRGVSGVHVQAGGYNAEPQPDWNILTRAQPLMSMAADGAPDPSKPPMASEWTREYTGKDGKKGRVFTSLYGASEDILNPGYLRLLINGIYWALGREDQIKADAPIDFVGPYEPNTFSGGGHAKGVKPAAYEGFASAIPANHDTGKKEGNDKKNERKEKREENKAEKSAAAPAAADIEAKAPVPNVRFVRVDLPSGEGNPLTLAEVEVISEGKNIAGSGKASQDSTGYGGSADRAIDGKKDPSYGKGGQTHTGYGPNRWWELDLGKNATIDQVEIWNRGEGFESRLDGFQISLLDENRKVLFAAKDNRAPDGSARFDFKNGGKLTYQGWEGKASQPLAKNQKKSGGGGQAAKPSVPLADVPADYRDPAPFAFQKDDVVAIIGNGLADRMQHEGWVETIQQSQTQGLEIRFRNMSITGDRADQFPRHSGFAPMPEYLRLVKPTVVFCMFGYNESYENNPASYEQKLAGLVKMIRGSKPGDKFPRIVLFSPTAHENLNNPNLPDGKTNNERLAQYTEATRRAAEASGVAFVDLFAPTKAAYDATEAPLTLNGVHLNEEGYRQLSEIVGKAVFGKEIKADREKFAALREAVIDKNEHWHKRYRRVDGNDIWGGRSTLKFVDDQTNADVLQHELAMLDVMTANRDPRIWARARGSELEVNDKNVPPPVPVKSNVGGGSKSSSKDKEGTLVYQDGREAIKDMKVPEGFEVNLFADEKKFPALVNPVQMQVDTKGRLWVAAWKSYPMWEPLKEFGDALLILEDTDGDGEADKVKEFAKIHNPLGFEFWNGGVIVGSQPDIYFLKDTDGDDVADVRHILFQGTDSADTHHAANNFIFGPDGGIYWQSGIFMQHNHEHPWGPSLITGASGMYRFDPRRYTIAFHASNSPNPHGTSFDYWGYLYANDGTGGRSFQVRPDGNGFKMFELLKKEVRPVPADEIVSSANFPDDMQQNFLVCNTIGFLGIKNYKLHRDGYEGRKLGEVWGTPEQDMLVSSDKNFRPTDAIFGSDGALYVADWQNVIIGHMQHNVRDPNRDHLHGRVYRIVNKNKPLQQPVAIDGEPLDRLMANLEHPINGVRHRTRVELSERPTREVIDACNQWLAKFDPAKPEDAHHFLEGLWVHQQHNVRDGKLLKQVMGSPHPHAAIAAAVVNHHWTAADPALGSQAAPEDKVETVNPGGILSQNDQEISVRIVTVVEKMKYDFTRFEVKAGQKVKVQFVNPDFMPHNVAFCKGKSGNEVAMAALMLGADGFKKHFIPETDKILSHTKMLDHGQEETIEFVAPKEKGEHDFVCTFPGHAAVMRGTWVVK